MEYAVRTHTGRIRENNEDSFYIDEKNSGIFIVADGMGGHNAGEIASNMAIETIKKDIGDNWDELIALNDYDIHSTLRKAIEMANKKIYEQSLLHIELDGMGTTLTIALIINNKLYLGHIGDSRAYLINKNEIKQLTEDHTLVRELLKNGSITEVEAKNHPKKNIITKALGTELNTEPDIFNIELNNEGILILCTDGLTNMMDSDEILESFIGNSELQKTCDKLIDLANERGGYDNITVMAIRFRSS